MSAFAAFLIATAFFAAMATFCFAVVVIAVRIARVCLAAIVDNLLFHACVREHKRRDYCDRSDAGGAQ